MKLLQAFKEQIQTLGDVKRVWLTTFNLNIDFVESHLLPVILGMDSPRNRLDYESFQWELVQRDIDVRVFCDKRMLEADQYKRTAIAVHPISPRVLAGVDGVDDETLFHPKVIYLENAQGDAILGAGSANLTVSGWGRNQEVFAFRRLSSQAQYQQIKAFFSTLDERLGLELEWPIKRKFLGDDPYWEFVHSFAPSSFLQRLFKRGDVQRLSVWSPYLSGDIPALLDRLRDVASNPELCLELVPDRLEGRYFRTPWSEDLEECLADGSLGFFDNPSQRHENTEMTHAKVWLAHGANAGRLAIGSWNFTHSGTSSLERRNIEAGILQDTPIPSEIVGKQLTVTAADFASQEKLQQEALELPPELPFDLQVCFDWLQSAFTINGQWHDGQPGADYRIKLPGVSKALLLQWKSRPRSGFYSLETIEHQTPDNEVLLADHSFAVVLRGETVYRGLILETGQSYRRAQGFDSLKDLFDSLIAGTDPAISDTLVLRGRLRDSAGPDEEVPLPSVKVEQDALSYFRLFQAIELYHQRLQQTSNREELDKWLFSYPGCVQELAAKARVLIQEGSPSVFNWFLAQEVNTLRTLAEQQLERFRERYARKQAPPERWSSLILEVPRLPRELSNMRNYLRRVREECGYAK